MELTPFIAYIGEQKRWVEIRPVYFPPSTAFEHLPDEYIIYSNDTRNAIGELRQGSNEENAILGTFRFLDNTVSLNEYEFDRKVKLQIDELRDISYAIKVAIVETVNAISRG